MMERSKGRDFGRDRGYRGLAEAHCEGFISILGSKDGLKIEFSKNATGERSYRIVK